MSSEYMLQLHKRLTEKTYGDPPRTLSPTTADAYIKTLFSLNDKQPFKSLAFLKKTDVIMKKLEGYAESTQKTLLATLTSVLGMDAKNKKAYQFYHDKMIEKVATVKEADTAVKTETQKENWITWEDVLKKQVELKETVEQSINKKLPLSNSQFNHLLSYIMLSLYIDVPPRRNQDYLNMYVYKATKKDVVDSLPKDKNYVIIAGGEPKQFIYNIYKTSKTYGQQTMNIPPILQTVLRYYLKRVANKAKEYKFLPFEKDNSITRLLNKVFEKKIGSSMLRHIYLSSKYNISEMKDDAKAMGHSVEEQKAYLKE